MTVTKNGGRRRMKQMQGLLLLSRLDNSPARSPPKIKPQRVMVQLQPQQLQLMYSSLTDQEMLNPLGRVDLRDAKLEQVPDGFIIHEGCHGLRKKLKLQDKDKATNDAWFFAVYSAISEYQRLLISFNEGTHKFSAFLTSSLRDEHTKTVEFELSCQLMLPARPISKPSIKWKVWKTFLELQAFNDELRVSFGAHMMQIMFPRDRKRDSLFGGMRKKSMQELKQQQLALYIEQVFQMPEISTEPVLLAKVKQFLGFNFFFEVLDPSSSKSNDNENQLSDPHVTVDPLSSESHTLLFADSAESNQISEPLQSSKLQDVGQSAIEPVGVNSHEPSSQHPSTEIASMPPMVLVRKISAALEDENEDLVEILSESDPMAARKLHKEIIRTVRELVANDEERVQDFQDQTKDFGRGKTSATEYCAFLLGAVGAQECCMLIPKMARLLADEAKRNELIQARAAVWRRTHRRHRRRSKQFSESVLLQNQEQRADAAPSAVRPKSDSFGKTKRNSESIHISRRLERNSMFDRPMPVVGCELHSDSAPANSISHAGLADPRRHLNRRASFSTMFGETLPTNAIKEENLAENEPESDSDDNHWNQLRTVSNNTRSTRIGMPTNLGNHNALFPGEDYEDKITEGDEETNRVYHSRRSHRSRHHQQSGIASSSIDASDASFSSEEVTQIRPLETSSPNEESSQECSEEENSHTRFHRSHRLASRKFDEEAKLGSSAREEKNPVLARLKKQGAVNFMMGLY